MRNNSKLEKATELDEGGLTAAPPPQPKLSYSSPPISPRSALSHQRAHLTGNPAHRYSEPVALECIAPAAQ